MLCGKNKPKQLFWIVKHLFNYLATLVKCVFKVGPLSNIKKLLFCSLVWGMYKGLVRINKGRNPSYSFSLI